jgi:hypothetical protein
VDRKTFWVAVPMLCVLGGCGDGSVDGCDEAAAAAKYQQALAAAQVCTPGVSTCVGYPDQQRSWCVCPAAVNSASVLELDAVLADMSSDCSRPCGPCTASVIQETCTPDASLTSGTCR